MSDDSENTKKPETILRKKDKQAAEAKDKQGAEPKKKVVKKVKASSEGTASSKEPAKKAVS